MKLVSARDLRPKTSVLINSVAEDQTYVIEHGGKPVAELRPSLEMRRKPLPDREAFIKRLKPTKTDSGRILEEDRA